MAMKLMDKESFEQELKKAGLEPTEHRIRKYRVWKTDDGKEVLVPETNKKLPDSTLDRILSQVNRLYR